MVLSDKTRILSVLIGLVSGVIFIIDLALPLGIASGMLYVAPVLLSCWLPQRRYIYAAAILGSLLTIAGYFWSPSGGELSIVLVNRGMALAAIWISAIHLSLRVTERQKSRLKIKDSEERLSAVIRTAVDGIITIDPRGTIESINYAVEDMFGYSEEELVGQNVAILMPEPDHSAHDGYLENYAKTGVAKIIGIGREVVARRKDGSIFPIFLSISELELGGITYYSGIIRNITDDNKLQQDLRDNEQRLLDAIESVTDGVSLYDKDDKLVLCNARLKDELSEISDKMVPGALYGDIVRALFEKNIGLPKGDQTVEDLISEQMAFHANPVEPIYRQEKNGRWIMLHEYRTRDGGTFFIRSNVTELKKAQDDALTAKDIANAANCTKSEFLANMSHELRTPLNAIIGYSETLSSEIFGPLNNDKQIEYVETIYKSGNHLLQLINDILDVSVIEAGKLALRSDQIQLDKLANEVMPLVQNRATFGGVELVNLIGSELPTIAGDELRVKQVVVNLLSNAVKFTPSGGSVSLSAEKEADGSAKITVTDTGFGMSEGDLAKAMEKFTQVNRGETHIAGEGTGLGLPLVKGLVEAHGGTLEISSEINVGTSAIVHFPKERVLEGVTP